MKALIAAGGRGTRLRPITHTVNKHMIPVKNVPMIYHALEKIAETGIKDVAININEGDREFMEAVGDGSQWGLNITYLEQKGGALGLAHIIQNAKEWLGDEPFVFYLGDNIVLGSLKPFIENFEKSGANAYLALVEVDDPQRFGVPEMDEEGNILRVIEKPENPPSPYAVTGIYAYDKSIHNAVDSIQPSERGELEISDAHTQVIEDGGKVKYEVVEGWWKDAGKPKDLLEGNRLLLDLIDHKNDAAQTDDTVTINGDVEIFEGAQLLGNTVLNGPVSIGRNTVIKDATIGPGTSVGHDAYIEDADIEHSIVMDEARIVCKRRFENSIIGHNAVIESKDPDKSKTHTMIVGEHSQLDL